MITNAATKRFASGAAAFVLTLGAAALVWRGGWVAGRSERRSATSARAMPTTYPSPSAAPNAFTDPATRDRTGAELWQRLAALERDADRATGYDGRRAAAYAVYDLGRAAHFQGKGGGTLTLAAYADALARFRAIGDDASAASLIADRADALALAGQPDAAEASLREALALREKGAGTDANRADVLYRLGDRMRVRGRYEEARTLLDRALRIQQRLGAEPGQADCLAALGQAAYEEGSYGLARQLLGEAARLFARNGVTESRAAVLGQLGDVALAEGNVVEASRLYREGLSVWEARRQWFWVGKFQVRLAEAALATGDLAGARELAEGASRLFEGSNGPVARAGAALILARVAAREGRKADARMLLNQAGGLYRVAGSAYGQVRSRRLIETLH